MLRYMIVLTMIFGSALPQQEMQEQPLDFVLSTEKSTYCAFEPLVLNMAVINVGQRPVQGDFNFLSFSCNVLKLFYRREGGGFKRYYSLRIWMAKGIDDLPGDRPILNPGSEWSKKEMLLFDTSMEQKYEHRFVLDEPGEYEFKATFQYLLGEPSKVVESNILHLTVVNPPEQEQEVLTWWKDKDLALVVQGDDLNEKGVRRLRVFLERFPESQYAAAARGAGERAVEKLATKAKGKTLTKDEKVLHELLRPNN